MFDYYQGKILIGLIVWLIFCFAACLDVNKDIDKSGIKMHKAPAAMIIFAILIVLVALFPPMTHN